MKKYLVALFAMLSLVSVNADTNPDLSPLLEKVPVADRPEVTKLLAWLGRAGFSVRDKQMVVNLGNGKADLLTITPIGPGWHTAAKEWKVRCTYSGTPETLDIDGATLWQDALPLVLFEKAEPNDLILAGTDDQQATVGLLLRQGLAAGNLRLTSGWGVYPEDVQKLQALTNNAQNFQVPVPAPAWLEELAQNVAVVQDGSGVWLKGPDGKPLLVTARHVARVHKTVPQIGVRAGSRTGQVTELKPVARGEQVVRPGSSAPTGPGPSTPFHDWAVYSPNGGAPAPTGLPYSFQPPVLGEPVVCLGYPYGYPGNGANQRNFEFGKGVVPGQSNELILSFGVVTGYKQDDQQLFSSLITTSCRARQGNSGGPLLRILGNGKFEVIGILLGSSNNNGPELASDPVKHPEQQVSSQFLPVTYIPSLWAIP